MEEAGFLWVGALDVGLGEERGEEGGRCGECGRGDLGDEYWRAVGWARKVFEGADLRRDGGGEEEGEAGGGGWERGEAGIEVGEHGAWTRG